MIPKYETLKGEERSAYISALRRDFIKAMEGVSDYLHCTARSLSEFDEHVELKGEEEVTIHARLDTWRERIGVFGVYPKPNNSKDMASCRGRFFEITFKASTPIKSMVSHIKRRLLGPYLHELVVVKQKVRAANDYQESKARLLARIIELTGGSYRRDDVINIPHPYSDVLDTVEFWKEGMVRCKVICDFELFEALWKVIREMRDADTARALGF